MDDCALHVDIIYTVWPTLIASLINKDISFLLHRKGDILFLPILQKAGYLTGLEIIFYDYLTSYDNLLLS